MRLFVSMTIFLLYKSHWRAHNLSCCLIASIGVYSRNVDQLSSPYLAIFRASFGSDFTLRREPAPLCLISSGFRTLTKIPSLWSRAATGSWYRPVASITTRVSGSMQSTSNAKRDNSISECFTSYGVVTSSPPGFMAATILLPLETSIPTTVIRFPPNLNLQWLPPFTYCLFNLLSNTNAPLRWDYLRKSNAANKNGGWLTPLRTCKSSVINVRPLRSYSTA